MALEEYKNRENDESGGGGGILQQQVGLRNFARNKKSKFGSRRI